jgi:hypothetical protein
MSSTKFVNVWSPKAEDPDYDYPDYNLAVSYNDMAAVFEDLVAESVALIEAFPGVDYVRLEDRELILVAGSPTPALLQDRLVGWWLDRLRDIAHA